MSATRTAYLLLALDLGAIWACLWLLLAQWRDVRAARSALAVDAASAVTALWAPGWNAPTAPMPTVAAVDPWTELAAIQPSTALVLPAAQPGERPTRALPDVETRRRRIDHRRNDPPAAAEPQRFVELILTRRGSPRTC